MQYVLPQCCRGFHVCRADFWAAGYHMAQASYPNKVPIWLDIFPKCTLPKIQGGLGLNSQCLAHTLSQKFCLVQTLAEDWLGNDLRPAVIWQARKSFWISHASLQLKPVLFVRHSFCQYAKYMIKSPWTWMQIENVRVCDRHDSTTLPL